MSVPGEAALAAAVTEPLAGTDAPTAPAAEASDTISLEAARKLRSEHESLRARLRDAEAKLKGHEDAALTEQEKARKDATDAAARAQQAEARLRQVTTERAIERAARDLSMSEELAVLLTTGHAWEYDDEGALRTNATSSSDWSRSTRSWSPRRQPPSGPVSPTPVAPRSRRTPVASDRPMPDSGSQIR
jgi:hypothetical protein